MTRAGFLLLTIVTLAGCVVAPPLPAQQKDGAARSAFFASDMTLTPVVEPTEHAARAGSFFAAWAQGADHPTWRAPISRQSVLVENMTAHVRLRVTGPVARTNYFPDLLVYAGSGDAFMGLGTTAAPTVLTPGTIYVFDVAITPPTGGLWVPAGEPLGVKVVPVMHQNDAADVEILTGGGADASMLRWTQRPASEAVATTLGGKDAGDVEGSAYAGAGTPPTAKHTTLVKLDALLPRILLAWMNTTDHQGIPDLDFGVLAPNGTQIAYAGTPTPKEALRLGPENLVGPGTYALVVTDYGSAKASFTVEWRAG